MDYNEATKKTHLLQAELNKIKRLLGSEIEFYIFPKLLRKEIERLKGHINKATVGMKHRIIIPVEGTAMLSTVPAEFGLSFAEATEAFKYRLNSELEELKKLTSQNYFTTEFLRKVISHTEAYLKNQRQHECVIFGPENDQIDGMDLNNAVQKRERLHAELAIIRKTAMERTLNAPIILTLTEAEVNRLTRDIDTAIMSNRLHSDEIKIPVEGAFMLSQVPIAYDLTCAAETERFIQWLYNEIAWLLSFDEKCPFTLQFIQRVIGYAESYMMEKRSFEVVAFGCTATEY